MSGTVWVVQTTLPGDWPEPIVGEWAFDLIESGLAACVQRDLVSSVFRWEGNVEESSEWRIQVKTSNTSKEGLFNLISEKHPYSTPQLLAWKAEATKDYTSWVEG